MDLIYILFAEEKHNQYFGGEKGNFRLFSSFGFFISFFCQFWNDTIS